MSDKGFRLSDWTIRIYTGEMVRVYDVMIGSAPKEYVWRLSISIEYMNVKEMKS